MSTRKLFLIVSSFTVLGLFMASCAPAVAPTPTAKPPAAPAPTEAPAAETPAVKAAAPSPSPKPAAEQPKYGGTMNISIFTAPEPYDIHQNSTASGVLPYHHCYNNLVQYHPHEQTKIIGDLAQSWDVSPDGMVYTFRIHKGVKWHDGKPFTAADAKFTLDRMHNPPKGTIVPKVGELMGAIKAGEAPDPETLKVTLKYVSASFIPALATEFCAIFPKHVIEEKGDMKRTIMGTGPFKFKSDIPDNKFEVVRNKEYFKEGRPYLDAIKYYIIKDASTRFAALRTKRIQMTFPIQGLLPAQLEKVKRELPEVTTAQIKGQAFIGYYFPLTKPPWNDVRVRRAISLALDRQEAVRVLEEGLGTVAGPMPPSPWALPQDEVRSIEAAGLSPAERPGPC